ncbi:MAG: alpha-L-fucosidase [Candidatus Aminicenantes bacterium]|nr:alpha-L-fucosidase [Candidatus Aminicenantes bacterium]
MIPKLALLLAVLVAVAFPSADGRETPAQKEVRMKWWTEARFGMFIHWGLYALPARHEWVKNRERLTDEAYAKYFDHFNPDLYDPKGWARTAKASGMKYFVVTTKHHEGFCLFDSKFTDYKATKTPYGRDLIAPLVQAMRDEGLKVGFYYSLIDWHHPEYAVDENHPQAGNAEFREKAKNRDMAKYREYLFAQVREILTNYGKIDCLFLDFSFPGKDGKGRADWDSERLLKMIRELQPGIIVNDRLDLLDVPGGWDFRTPEQYMPREWVKVDGQKVPWETCQTFSGSWGYHRDEATWKSVRQLVLMLIETVSKGGNLLLNVGPTARGTFDDRAMDRLAGIGAWMKLHDRSITGCTEAPEGLAKAERCLFTYNPAARRLYVHVLEWPMGTIVLEGLGGKVKYAQLLNDASEIAFRDAKTPRDLGYMGYLPGERREEANAVILRLPVKPPDVAVPVIELFLK